MPTGLHRNVYAAGARYWRDIALHLREQWEAGYYEYAWAALYLVGYSVECALKVLICRAWGDVQNLEDANELIRTRQGTDPRLTSAEGHNLRRQLRLANLTQAVDKEIGSGMHELAVKWSTDWRYELPYRQDLNLRTESARAQMWDALSALSERVIARL